MGISPVSHTYSILPLALSSPTEVGDSPAFIPDELSLINAGDGISQSLGRNEKVIPVQRALQALGLLSLRGNSSDGRNMDGKFWDRTYCALKQFRQKAGLDIVSDKITQEDINAMIDILKTAKKRPSGSGWDYEWEKPSGQAEPDASKERIQKLEGQLQDLRSQMAEHESRITGAEEKTTAKSGENWFDNMNLKGDFRVRYQMDRNSDGQAKNRIRIRGRLGADFELDEKTSIHAGIATGSGDPRSTNATLEGEFNGKQVNIDYVYGKYQFAPWGNVKIGKIKQEEVFWQPTDLVWDTDINPEGIALGLTHKLDKEGRFEGFVNAGHLFFGKSDFGLNGPSVSFVQPGIKADLGGGFYARAALDAFFYQGFQGAEPFKFSSGTNSLRTLYEYSYDQESNELTREEVGQVVRYDYDSVGISAEAGKKFESGKVASVYGNYVHNYKADENNNGYAVGVKYGDEKVDDKGKWEVRALYRHLEKDACPDNLPDSDAFGGKTGTEGFKLSAAYGVSKNVSLAASYYNMHSIDDHDVKDQVVQLDINLKFGGSRRKKTAPVPTLEPQGQDKKV
jgi:hypothetical protein